MTIQRRRETNLAAPSTRKSPLDLLGIAPQPWMSRANCAGTDPEAFFPEKGGSTREAKAICARCPVQAECLDYALADGQTSYSSPFHFGIWGGLSEYERRAVRHQLDQENPPQEEATA